MKRSVIVVFSVFLAAGLPFTGLGGFGDVGPCVIGVDSPCNGDRWDGDIDPLPPAEPPYEPPFDEPTPPTEEPRFGPCVVGVDSPCNGDEWNGPLQRTQV